MTRDPFLDPPAPAPSCACSPGCLLILAATFGVAAALTVLAFR